MISQYCTDQMNDSLHTVCILKEIKSTLEGINNIEMFTSEELLYMYHDGAVS